MTTYRFNNLTINIMPRNLKEYLKAKGWSADSNLNGKAIIWHRNEPDAYDYEVIQPESTDVKGYKQRVLDAIGSLAEFEGREPTNIIQDIENFFSDSIKIRVVHSDVEGGTIPINDGVLLIEKSRDLLVATTLSTFCKRAHFKGQRSREVQNYLSQLRLGQTEVGSFVVNLIAPISESNDIQLAKENMSLTRAVSNNLSRSLLALSNVVDKYEKISNVFEFEEIVNYGVSANLCDALIGLTGESKTRSFSVTVCLAGYEYDSQELQKQFNFKPEQVPTLELASDFYKGNYVIKTYEAYGLVTKMRHLPEDDYGEITVKTLVRDTEKNVLITLPLESYWQAVHAHEETKTVSCKGALHVTPKSAKLIDSYDFKVIDKSGSLGI